MRHDITQQQIEAALGNDVNVFSVHRCLDGVTEQQVNPREGEAVSWTRSKTKRPVDAGEQCPRCYRGTRYPAYEIDLCGARFGMSDLESLSELFETKLINISFTADYDSVSFTICVHEKGEP